MRGLFGRADRKSNAGPPNLKSAHSKHFTSELLLHTEALVHLLSAAAVIHFDVCKSLVRHSLGISQNRLTEYRFPENTPSFLVLGLHWRRGMRPLPQMRERQRIRINGTPTRLKVMLSAVLLATSVWTLGCGGGGAGSVAPRPQSAGGTAATNTAVYAAPATAPQPNSAVVTVTPQADPAKQTQAVITIQAGSSISVSPPNAALAANHRVTLTAALGGISGGSIATSLSSSTLAPLTRICKYLRL